MKRIKLTAEYTTTLTREFEVEDDWNPYSVDLDNMWYEKNIGDKKSTDEQVELLQNLQMNEVWLVRDENDNDIYVR